MIGKNDTVLITGASRGIGAETAKLIAESTSAKIIIGYREKRNEAIAVAHECMELGARLASVHQLNLNECASDLELTTKHLIREHGPITVLINNAAVMIDKPLGQQTALEVEGQIRVNLTSQIILARYLLLTDRLHTLVNVGSDLGLSVLKPNVLPYTVAKHGLIAASQALALEFSNCYVTCVVLDSTATDMHHYPGRPARESAQVVVGAAMSHYAVHSGSIVDIRNLPQLR